MRKQGNYKVLRELLLFATATEGDISALSKAEVNDRLRYQGVDPDELAAATADRLRIVRSAIAKGSLRDRAGSEAAKAFIPFLLPKGLTFASRPEGLKVDDHEAPNEVSKPDGEEGSR